jgi:hypothetical protein
VPHLVSLETAAFDLGKEPNNPMNPIGGHSLLAWLRASLKSHLELTEPACEDWGWYSTGTFDGSDYLIGACAMGQPDDVPPLEWQIQIHKQRSLLDKLLGKNRMAPDDPLSAVIVATVKDEPAFSKVERRIE